MMPSRSFVIPVLMGALLWGAWLPRPALGGGVNSVWNGGNGVWSDVTMWTPGVVPNNNGSDYNVTIDGSGVVVSKAVMDIAAVICNLTISAGDTLMIEDFQTLEFEPAAFIDNASIILLNQIRLRGATTLAGWGTIQFDTNPLNAIFSTDPGAHLYNINNVIRGEGTIDLPGFTNQRKVDADAGAGKELKIVSGAMGVVNIDTLQAGDGVLVLQKGASGLPFANGTGGVIQALGSSTVSLRTGAHITGGTLQSVGDSSMVELTGYGSFSPTLENVILDGKIEVSDACVARIKGLIENRGSVRLEPDTGLGLTHLCVIDTVTLAGGGSIKMGNGDYVNAEITADGSGHLINQDNTIHGAGNLGGDHVCIDNLGSILADSDHPLTIDPGPTGFKNKGYVGALGFGGLVLGDGSWINEGTVYVESGSSLNAAGNYRQTAGETTINGFAGVDTIFVEGGRLGGGGYVVAEIELVNGVLAAGYSPGWLIVQGGAQLYPPSLVEVEIGGTTAGLNYDLVTFTGAVALAGTLQVSLLPGFVPSPGDTFKVFQGSPLTGAFDAVVKPPFFDVTVTGTDVLITVNGTVDVPDDGGPARLLSLRAYPNPMFGAGLHLSYGLPEDAAGARVDIYDINGRRVRSWTESELAGRGAIAWDGRDMNLRSVSSGVYFVRLAAGHSQITRRIVKTSGR